MSGLQPMSSNSPNSSYLGSSNLSTSSSSSEVGDKRKREDYYSDDEKPLKRSNLDESDENDYDVVLEGTSPFEEDPLTKITTDVSFLVFDLLSKSILGSCAQVSKGWKKLAENDTLWKKFLPKGVEVTKNIKEYIKSKSPLYYGAQYCESYEVAIQQFENFVQNLPINSKGKYQVITPGSNQKIECELKVRDGVIVNMLDSKIAKQGYDLYERCKPSSWKGYHNRGPDYNPFETVEYGRKYMLNSPAEKEDQSLVTTNLERTLSKDKVTLNYKLNCSLPASITKECIERFHKAINEKLYGDTADTGDIENDWELI